MRDPLWSCIWRSYNYTNIAFTEPWNACENPRTIDGFNGKTCVDFTSQRDEVAPPDGRSSHSLLCFPLAKSLSLNGQILKQSTVDYTTIIMVLTSASAVRPLCYVFNHSSVFEVFDILSTLFFTVHRKTNFLTNLYLDNKYSDCDSNSDSGS